MRITLLENIVRVIVACIITLLVACGQESTTTAPAPAPAPAAPAAAAAAAAPACACSCYCSCTEWGQEQQ